MRKVYKNLTEEQKARGVIFSSELVPKRGYNLDSVVHEVLATDEDKHTRINRLLDDRFFNRSPFSYNLIRQ